ncbi:MAG: amidohydrolase family protein, partial [Bauldia sp.]|nr:amidohydrolase family protein [Bauldia sp.]
MPRTLIKGAAVWDGSSAQSRPVDVLVTGNRITAVGKDIDAADAEVIEASGTTLMPGLVEGHCHLSFVGIRTNADLGVIPPEEHLLGTAANARLLLEHGFTSAYSAASAKPRLDVVIRNAINAGQIVGPRLRAASPEITSTGGLGDERMLHMYQESFGAIADGPIEIRRVCRTFIREGVDNLKVNISGDEFVSSARAEITTMQDDEIAAAVEVAHAFHKQIACHARSSDSVKRAVRNGIDCIYHCDYADEEALDMLESVKDHIFVGPAFGLVHNSVFEGERAGMTREVVERMGLFRKFDHTCATYHEIRKRGIRVVVGGDYGFSITPMGQNARDIAHFVKYFGYSPAEALQCATRIGGELMGIETGQIKEGYLADILLVRGDPLADVSILQNRDNLALIMKDGVVYKGTPRGQMDSGLMVAAE